MAPVLSLRRIVHLSVEDSFSQEQVGELSDERLNLLEIL